MKRNRIVLMMTVLVFAAKMLPGQSLNIATFNVRYANPRDSGNLWADRAPVVVEVTALATMAATEGSRAATFIPVVPVPGAGTESDQEAALLASRRVDLAGVFHPQTDDNLLASASPSSHTFVEIPAVVVSRAVMVAGRGIRTGLRATGAVFRAAF